MLRCMIVDDDEFSRAVLEHYVARHKGLELVASCPDAIEAVNRLRDTTVDLLFLDVEMPEMTGLELAQRLATGPPVILVTSKEEYALEAFDAEVVDYLLKPVEYARFLKAVARAEQSRQEAPVNADYAFIKVDGRLVKLNLPTVQWIEAQGDYVLIHTPDRDHLVLSTMKGIQKKLPDAHFVRVHRSYIVRIDQIDNVEDTTLVVGRKVIPIGASYRNRLLNQIRTL